MELAPPAKGAGLDGIVIGGDGNVSADTFTEGKMFRVDVKDGKAGKLTQFKTSRPTKLTDAMRDADGNSFLVIEGNCKLDRVTVNGDTARLDTLKDGVDGPTGVTKVGGKGYVTEGQLTHLFGGAGGKGQHLLFKIYEVPLRQAKSLLIRAHDAMFASGLRTAPEPGWKPMITKDVGQNALRLEPVARPAGAVCAVEPLRNNALKLVLAGDLEEVRAVARELLAHQDRRPLRDDAAQREPTLLKRLLSQILAVEEQQVEGVEHRAPRAVAVEVGLPMGAYTYDKRLANGGIEHVRAMVYLLEVEKETGKWREKDQREREWVSTREARRRVDEDGLKAIFKQLDVGPLDSRSEPREAEAASFPAPRSRRGP